MRRRDFIKALARSATAWPLAALAQHAIPGTTRAYVMNGLFVGTGLATIAARLRQRGYIVAYGSYKQDRAFAADACAHPADRIVVIGHSFGAEAAAESRDPGGGLWRSRRDHDWRRSGSPERGQGSVARGKFRRRIPRHDRRSTKYRSPRLHPYEHHGESGSAGAYPIRSGAVRLSCAAQFL